MSTSETPGDASYTVVLAQSGVELDIPVGKSILDELLDAGFAPNHSCCEGYCGSCEVKVLEGLPDHRDVVLSTEDRQANDRMMICCSGSLAPLLVLDL